MTAPGVSVRLVGGPAAVDGTLAPTTIARDGVILLAVRGRRWCQLGELDAQCTDRASAEQVAASWILARYEIWGRPRRVRPQLYRHTATFALVAGRDPRGRWTLTPGRRHETAVSAANPAGGGGAGRDPAARSALRSASLPSVWARLEEEVDRAAARFARVAALLPDGPLAERAQGAVRSGDACVADAVRLCAVGATVAPGWEPGAPDDEAVALVTRITSLLGTIDEATREVVRLHLELGDPEPPAQDLALLAASVAEIEASTKDRLL